MTAPLFTMTATVARDRASSHGPSRAGYLTETELASRWGRSFNTLVGWRTRPLAERQRLPYEIHARVVYYAVGVVRAFEAAPANAWVRPKAARGTVLPPLLWGCAQEPFSGSDVAHHVSGSPEWRGSRAVDCDVSRWFEYRHLPEHLQLVSLPFSQLASELQEILPPSVERDMALRKLLESKDCAVRAAILLTDASVDSAPIEATE